MSKRTRIDSKEAKIQAFKLANKEIQPPAHYPLDKDDMPFFRSVIAEFAKSEWSDHQLELAAMLARMMCDMEREQAFFRSEGSVAYSEKGTPVVNPRKTVIQMLSGSILATRRSLSLHARAQGGDKRDIAKRSKTAKQHEADAMSLDDDLIARPN